jgi:uncharacterized protein (DUF1697 family)
METNNDIIVQSVLDLQKLIDTLERRVENLAKVTRSLVPFMQDEVSQAQVMKAVDTILNT